jgi:indolepyruvate ferredoxin oxidoreductase
MERQLIADYRALVNRIVERLNHANLPLAIELAGAAAQIAGYGPVKLDSVNAYESRLSALLDSFEKAPTTVAARAA